jgi:rod shape determining protein RodA
MVTGVVPVVGVTLPLMSYGGSSVLAVLIGIGLLNNVAMRRFVN